MRAIALTLLLCACGSTQEVRKTPTAPVPRHEPGAAYEVTFDGLPIGDVTVYSKGAFKTGGDAFVHVGFDVENRRGQPLVLDAVLVTAGDKPIEIRPEASSDLSVPAGASRSIDVLFELPSGAEAVRVRWTLSGGGMQYSRATAFVEERAFRTVSDDDGHSRLAPYLPGSQEL
jgi:hypothetical protein